MTIGQVEHRWRHLRESFSNQSLPNLKHRACHIYRKKKTQFMAICVLCLFLYIYLCTRCNFFFVRGAFSTRVPSTSIHWTKEIGRKERKGKVLGTIFSSYQIEYIRFLQLAERTNSNAPRAFAYPTRNDAMASWIVTMERMRKIVRK